MSRAAARGHTTMRVVVVNHVTLDGVLQAPARPDEDPTGGFRHGGWATERGSDPAIPPALGARMGPDFAWLFGRRSYDDMLTHWNQAGGPFKDGLNATTKYVATSTPDLPWPNSIPVTGDVAAEVRALRARPGGNLVIMGSAMLIHTLLAADQIDELFLMIHPLVLGEGKRLWPDAGRKQRMNFVSAEATATGLVLATYRAAPEPD